MLNSTFYVVNLTLIWSTIDFLYAQLDFLYAQLKQRWLPTTKTFNRYPPRVPLPHKHWRPLETYKLMTSEIWQHQRLLTVLLVVLSRLQTQRRLQPSLVEDFQLKTKIEHFIEHVNSYHPTINFTAEVSQLETTFLDTTVYKGERFEKESILYVRTRYKPTETFQYTNYNSCHPAGVKKGFVKGEALRLLRTNSSKDMFDKNIKNFRTRLISRGYPNSLVDKILSEVNFADRKNALTQKQKAHKKILPFVTRFQPSLSCLKNILMDKWHLIQNQPLLREIYKEPPLISYRKGP